MSVGASVTTDGFNMGMPNVQSPSQNAPSHNDVPDRNLERPPKLRLDRLHPTDRVGGSRQKSTSRHFCVSTHCDKSFQRSYDLARHLNTIHGAAREHYHCATVGCKHQNRRIDKVREHCYKQHGLSKEQAQIVTVDDRTAVKYGCPLPCADFGDATEMNARLRPRTLRPLPDVEW